MYVSSIEDKSIPFGYLLEFQDFHERDYLESTDSSRLVIICKLPEAPRVDPRPFMSQKIRTLLDSTAYALSLLFEFEYDPKTGPTIDDVFRAKAGVAGIDFKSRTSHPETVNRPKVQWFYSNPERWILPKAYGERSWYILNLFNNYAKSSNEYLPTMDELTSFCYAVHVYGGLAHPDSDEGEDEVPEWPSTHDA